MSKVSSPVRPRPVRVSPSANCRGRIPIPTRLERWMRSKLSAMTARTPRSAGPLAAQSRDDPDPYSWPGQHHERDAVGLVAHGGVVDAHLLAVGQMAGDPALGARGEQVAEADVGEGPAHHHLVVAAAGAVGVELGARRRRARSGTRRRVSSGRIDPAGEMWSVVTLSPSTASTRAPTTSATGAGLGGRCRRRTAAAGRRWSPASQ